jgi:hypothetical protein
MIEKLNTILTQLPPNWLSRVTSGRGEPGEAAIRKLLGEPIPPEVPFSALPPEIKALFSIRGMLERIKKKLEWISRKRGGRLVPAKNTIACVDSEDNVYIGVDFLKRFHTEEDLIAGIMAHEWGHMLSEIPPGTDLSHLSWDEIMRLRRDEELAADAFAGRAIFQMGYDVERMIAFLDELEKMGRALKTEKYYSAEIRGAVLRRAFELQKEAAEEISRLFGSGDGIIDPKGTRLIAIA